LHNARREALWLAESARDDSHLDELVRRRLAGEPLQYLTGVAGFRYLELQVGPGVLIPRPETEVVAQWAIDLLPAGGIAIDVGTGSGAIALAIAHERRDARVLATDVSPDALVWAERNRAALGLEVELVRGDLFEGVSSEWKGRIDVVVSNPPYVAYEERDSLPSDVRDHEPEVALFSPGEGVAVIARLAEEARSWLQPGGHLVLEIAPMRVDEVTDALAAYEDVMIQPDLTGRARVAVARRV
jgi:release factor glutamine methyltransferase